jgi:hypothetical protein
MHDFDSTRGRFVLRTDRFRPLTVHRGTPRRRFRSSRLRFSVARARVVRAAGNFVRAEAKIGRREAVFDGWLDHFDRRDIFSGQRGQGFLRRDTDFRRDAEDFVPREYVFAARDTIFLAASRLPGAGACAAVAARAIRATLDLKITTSAPPTSRIIKPPRPAGSSQRQSESNFCPAAFAVRAPPAVEGASGRPLAGAGRDWEVMGARAADAPTPCVRATRTTQASAGTGEVTRALRDRSVRVWPRHQSYLRLSAAIFN